MNRIQSIRNKLEQQKGQYARVKRTVAETEDKIKRLSKDLKQHEKAREIIRIVGLETQKQLQYHIEDITSLALESVFDDPYELIVEFVERRNKTECDLFFMRGKSKMNPLSASGGGTVDVAAFALRVASWSMEHPKLRNTIILDEPLRFLSQDHQEKASIMIKEISDKLGIQFIIITHESTLAAYADKIFETKIKKGVTEIK